MPDTHAHWLATTRAHTHMCAGACPGRPHHMVCVARADARCVGAAAACSCMCVGRRMGCPCLPGSVLPNHTGFCQWVCCCGNPYAHSVCALTRTCWTCRTATTCWCVRYGPTNRFSLAMYLIRSIRRAFRTTMNACHEASSWMGGGTCPPQLDCQWVPCYPTDATYALL